MKICPENEFTNGVLQAREDVKRKVTPCRAPALICFAGREFISLKHTDAGWSSSVARWAHNPEVAGSNPAPATSFRRSGPFPGRERAFCVSDAVVSRVVKARLRAARSGDGVTRDETAWTWWTLPPATAGCLAQRYASASRSLPIRAGLAGTCGAQG